MATTRTRSIDLPVPRDALLELGLTEDQIAEAEASRPLVVAFQADQHPGAWFDVDRAKKALRALGAFRHTKGRWAGVPMRLGEGLDPWQVVWVLAPVFGWVWHDAEIDRIVRVVRSVWVEVPRKAGKALALDTAVPTPSGWTTQGALEVGDQIYAADGTPTRVVAVTNVMHERPCYQLTFSDGEQITADAGHLWQTYSRVQGRSAEATSLRTTQDIYETATHGSRGDRTHAVALAGALQAPEADLPVDPYVLGYWLGDGHSASARITIAREDLCGLLAQVEAAGYVAGEPKPYPNSMDTVSVHVSTREIRKGSRDSLQARLRALGVLGDKHVPDLYMRASTAQRLAVLQGLMDSDGTISVRGVGGNITACEFTGTSRTLCEQVLELVRSLGLKATIREGRASIGGRDIGAKYRVTFVAHAETPVFRLARKLVRQVSAPATAAQRVRSRTRQIVSVEPVESVPVRCIQVENPDGMYLAGRAMVPTHNSTLSSGISGVLLLADGEAGAEVYNAAGSTLQAGRVFEDAKRMLMTSPAARKRVEPLKEVIRVPKTGSILRVLSRVAETAHGLNVSGAIVDEVHTLRLRRALVEAIETGVGARDQPLIVFITTADEAEEGTIYDEKHTYTRNMANGIVNDPGHYGVIWAADKNDDPFVEATWRKANPGLGKSPTLAYMRRESQKAQTTPTYFPTFCRLSLNLRMREQSRWLDMPKWDELDGEVDRSALRGSRAWGGLDLSAVSDFAAWAVWAEAKRPGANLDLLCRFWLPEERADELQRRLQVPIRQWAADGFLTLTEGDVIDYGAIKSAVIGDCRHLDMQQVAYDRMFAGQMVQEISTELAGVPISPVAQTFLGLSGPCKELERMVGARSFRHGGNPIMRWMASLVEVKNDGSDNIRPVKPDRAKSISRIDGIQAAVTALDGIVRGIEKTNDTTDRRVVVRRW